MTKHDLMGYVKSAQMIVTKHSPEILTGIGIAGMFTTTILAVKATPKALRLIEERESEMSEVCNEYVELSVREKIKVAWKPYIPAAITGIASTACLIGANSVNAKRNAVLATAYKISETALSEYREKVIETIGEKKEQQIRHRVAEEQLEKNPISKSEVILTQNGDTLFLDPLSKRYFESDIELIRKAENVLNKQMLHDITGYVSLSDFYDEIGLDRTDVSDDLGWNVHELVDIDFHPKMTSKGKPCLVIDYLVPPKYKYTDFI